MPTRRKTASNVRYNVKFRASNVHPKKPPVDVLVEKLSTLKRKHKESLCENKALAKSLADSKQELTEQSKVTKREREIFSIHLPRVKAWMEDSASALHKVMLNQINSVKLLRQILDPDGRLSLTPLETSALEEVTNRKELHPPGSHLQVDPSVIYEEDEEEEEHGKKEELPPDFAQLRLDNVTRRNARSEQILCKRWSSPLMQPSSTESTDDLNLQTTELSVSEESSLDVPQVVPAASTPVCPPKASPRRRSGRRCSIAPGAFTFGVNVANRRNSERIQKTTCTEPKPSRTSHNPVVNIQQTNPAEPDSFRSPQNQSVLSHQSNRVGTPSVVEQTSPGESYQDTPHDSLVTAASTPVCPPKASPRRRSGKRRSIAPGALTFGVNVGNRRKSKRIRQTTTTEPDPSRSPHNPSVNIQQTNPAEPDPSRSPHNPNVLGDRSHRAGISSVIEQPSAREYCHNTPCDSLLESSERRTKRRAVQAVSYKEPNLTKKLRRP